MSSIILSSKKFEDFKEIVEHIVFQQEGIKNIADIGTTAFHEKIAVLVNSKGRTISNKYSSKEFLIKKRDFNDFCRRAKDFFSTQEISKTNQTKQELFLEWMNSIDKSFALDTADVNNSIVQIQVKDKNGIHDSERELYEEYQQDIDIFNGTDWFLYELQGDKIIKRSVSIEEPWRKRKDPKEDPYKYYHLAKVSQYSNEVPSAFKSNNPFIPTFILGVGVYSYVGRIFEIRIGVVPDLENCNTILLFKLPVKPLVPNLVIGNMLYINRELGNISSKLVVMEKNTFNLTTEIYEFGNISVSNSIEQFLQLAQKGKIKSPPANIVSTRETLEKWIKGHV